MLKHLWKWALRKLQGRCEHDPSNVVADILEGGDLPHQVQWCRICGSYRHVGLPWNGHWSAWWLVLLALLLPLPVYAQTGPGPVPYRGINNWPLIFGTDNTYDIGASGATRPRTGYFGTSVITPSLTVSGLTSGRVPFASTGGLLADDADLTFDGTRLSATSATVASQLVIPAGSTAATAVLFANDTDTWMGSAGVGNISFYTNNAERFRMGATGTLSMSAGITLGPSIAVPDAAIFRVSAGVARVSSSAAGTVTTYFLGGGANVASASALPVPAAALYHVTGTTTVTSITSTNMGTGVCVVLIFDGILTMTDGSNLKLAGDFVTSADDTLTICYDGSNWFETSRSVN